MKRHPFQIITEAAGAAILLAGGLLAYCFGAETITALLQWLTP